MKSGITVMRNVEPEVWYYLKNIVDCTVNVRYNYLGTEKLETNNEWLWQVTRELRSSLEEIE